MTNAATQATTCGATDWTCQCTSTSHYAILKSSRNCVDAECGESQWLETIKPAADAFCNAVNGGETCSTPTSNGTSTASIVTTSTVAGATPTTPDGTSMTLSSSGTATGTATGAATSSSAGAALAGPVNSFGMLVLGLLALV
ncbi:unnamed protein product [Discula destructiva]